MAVLANFPRISQRDGDLNADYDCVPASIANCLTWLVGKPYTASQVKDAVYGQAYTGGTDAHKYVGYCAEQGVTLAPMDGNGSQLVSDLRSAIAAGHPCLITEPDPYAAGWTHVCAAYADDGTSITVMDPWIDQPVANTDGEWAAQLQDNEIWVLVLEDAMLSITDPWVSVYFKQTASNPDRWQCTNGQTLYAGILAGWRAMNGAPRLPTGAEVKCGSQAVYQECESGIVLYDPAHEFDAPGGPWAPCYLLKLGSPLAKLLLNIGQPTPAQIPTSVIDDLRALRTSNAATDAQLAKVLMELGVPV